MKKLSWLSALTLVALIVGLWVGCGKKADTKTSDTTTPAAPEPTAAVKLSGSQDVLSAIDRKDYDGAIALLLRMKQSASSPEQQVEFAHLADQARIKLLEAAPTQPKAAEALGVLRRITGGR